MHDPARDAHQSDFSTGPRPIAAITGALTSEGPTVSLATQEWVGSGDATAPSRALVNAAAQAIYTRWLSYVPHADAREQADNFMRRFQGSQA